MKLDTQKEDKIEIQVEQQQKKEIKLIGSQRKIPGLTTWEYNQKTKEINPAKFISSEVNLKSVPKGEDKTKRYYHDPMNKIVMVNKLVASDNCIYIQALTKGRAIYKLSKRNLL